MIAVDGQVLGLALGATVLSALLFGLAPALRLARTTAGEALKEGSRAIAGSAQQRTRRVLAAAEVALAFVLVVSSGLLLRSFVSMVTRDPGFQPLGAMTASIELPTVLYDDAASRGVLPPSGRARARAPGRARGGLQLGPAVVELRREHELRHRRPHVREGRGAGGALSLHHGGLPAGDGHAAPGRPRSRGLGRRRRTAGRPDERGGRAQVLDDAGGRGRGAGEPVGQGADGGRRDRRRPGHAVARAHRARALFPAAADVVPAADVPDRADRRRSAVGRRVHPPRRGARSIPSSRSRACGRSRAWPRPRRRRAASPCGWWRRSG